MLMSATGMSALRVCMAITHTNNAAANAFTVFLRRVRSVNHMPRPITRMVTVSVMK